MDIFEKGDYYCSGTTGLNFRREWDDSYVVDFITEWSPAEKAGLKPDYIIQSIAEGAWGATPQVARSFSWADKLGHAIDTIVDDVVIIANLPGRREERFVIRKSAQAVQDRTKEIAGGIIDLSKINWRGIGNGAAFIGSTAYLVWITGLMMAHNAQMGDSAVEPEPLPANPAHPSIVDTRPAPKAEPTGIRVSPDMRTVTIEPRSADTKKPPVATPAVKSDKKVDVPHTRPVETPKKPSPKVTSVTDGTTPPSAMVAKIENTRYVRPERNPWNADRDIARQVYSPANPDFKDPFNKKKPKPKVPPVIDGEDSSHLDQPTEKAGGGSKKCPPEKPNDQEKTAPTPENGKSVAPKEGTTEKVSEGTSAPHEGSEQTGTAPTESADEPKKEEKAPENEISPDCIPWVDDVAPVNTSPATGAPATSEGIDGIDMGLVGPSRLKKAQKIADTLTKMGKTPQEIREILSQMIQESGLDHTHSDGIGHVTDITRADMLKRPERYVAHIHLDGERVNSLFPGEKYAELRAALTKARNASNKKDMARHMSTILGHYDDMGVQLLVSEAVMGEKGMIANRPNNTVRNEALNILAGHKSTIGYALARSMGPSVSDGQVNSALNAIAAQIGSGEAAILKKLDTLSAYNVGHASAGGIPYAIITLARAHLLGR